MKQRIAVLIDGGHLRVYAKKAKKAFDPDFIEKVAHACVTADEQVHRVLFYDCPLFEGSAKKPVSGTTQEFKKPASDWLRVLAQRDLFAVRRGVLKFRGYVLNSAKIPYTPTAPLTDDDFLPKFEQKGVDMRIGLDMATLSANRSVEVIALVSNDTDCIPAMKHARRSGIQVALVVVPGYSPTPELLVHSDFRRNIAWPA